MKVHLKIIIIIVNLVMISVYVMQPNETVATIFVSLKYPDTLFSS